VSADSGTSRGHVTLLLGGARSGKSRYALEAALARPGAVLYVATAQAFDDEMSERIVRHRAERPAHWQTLEAPLHLGQALAGALQDPAQAPATVVVDCLTLLASNVLLALPEEATQEQANAAVLAEADALLHTWRAQAAPGARLLIVSNEVGMGVVPPSRLGRYYRDALGYANQRIAAQADEVLLLVAGLPWRLKPAGAAP